MYLSSPSTHGTTREQHGDGMALNKMNPCSYVLSHSTSPLFTPTVSSCLRQFPNYRPTEAGRGYLMLEFSRVPAADRDYAPVHMELPDYGNASAQFKSEGFLRALP